MNHADRVKIAWQALLRLPPPQPVVVHGLHDERVHPSFATFDERAEWYRRGADAQRADRAGLLSRYPAHWVLDDDLQVSEYYGQHDDRRRVASLDELAEEEIPYEEGASTPWASDDEELDNHDDPSAFIAGVVEVAQLTRRERQVAEWIGSGNGVMGVDYAERLAEALGCNVLAARKAVQRLRAKLVDHWAS